MSERDVSTKMRRLEQVPTVTLVTEDLMYDQQYNFERRLPRFRASLYPLLQCGKTSKRQNVKGHRLATWQGELSIV